LQKKERGKNHRCKTAPLSGKSPGGTQLSRTVIRKTGTGKRERGNIQSKKNKNGLAQERPYLAARKKTRNPRMKRGGDTTSSNCAKRIDLISTWQGKTAKEEKKEKKWQEKEQGNHRRKKRGKRE